MNTIDSPTPNILLISFEDTSPRFGCYGDPIARTPYVDSLAAAGCIYTNAFATAGVCAPSRASIITGMFPTAIGAMHMRTTHQNSAAPELPTDYDVLLPHYAKCYPEYLRAAGYYCTNNAKTDYQFRAPSSAWDACHNQAHWRNRQPNQAFLAVFNLDGTHESCMWPQHGGQPQTDPDSLALPPYLPDTRRAREALARQYDAIADSDTFVGKLLAQLEEDGETDNTIVMIWSDHGEGLPRAKRWVYDQGIRVPLIVKWPDHIDPGSISQQLVSMMDLGPTILSCCGLDIPQHMHGQAFMGPQQQERQYIHACRDRFDESYDMIRAVRDQRYKYICNWRPDLPRLLWIPFRNKHPCYADIWDRACTNSLSPEQAWFAEQSRPVHELYDIEQDPWEMNNLAHDPNHADTLKRLATECKHFLNDVGDLGEIDEATLVRTWYPDGQAPQVAPVVFIPHTVGQSGIQAVPWDPRFDNHTGRTQLSGHTLIVCYCATQGASIEWTTDEGDESSWHLYTGPIPINTGQHMIRARAVRIGHQDSPICTLMVTVLEAP